MREIDAIEAMGAELATRGHLPTATVAAEIAALRAERGLPAQVQSGDPAASAQPGVSIGQPSDADPDISALAFAPPADVSGYDLLPRGVVPASPEQHAEVEQVARACLAVGLPSVLVAQVAKDYAAAVANPPDELARAHQRAQTMQSLARIYGEAEVPRVLATARAEYSRMLAIAPALQTMVDESGLGDSLFLLASLVNNANAKGRG